MLALGGIVVCPTSAVKDALRGLRQAVRRDLLAESRKHGATKWLRQISSIGPMRAALLVALIQTPHRLRSKRQLWTYSGWAIDTRHSGQYRYVAGQLHRAKKAHSNCGAQGEPQAC